MQGCTQCADIREMLGLPRYSNQPRRWEMFHGSEWSVRHEHAVSARDDWEAAVLAAHVLLGDGIRPFARAARDPASRAAPGNLKRAI